MAAARLVLVLVVLVLPALARALDGASAADVEEGKARFAAGSAYFKKGDYQRAMIEFQAGYALARRNGFLLNIGLCQRQLGQKEAALGSFRGLLEREPNFGRRADVERYIHELEVELGLVPDVPASAPEPAGPVRADTPTTAAAVAPVKRADAAELGVEDEAEDEAEADDEADPADEIALVSSRKTGPASSGPRLEPGRPLLVQARSDESERAGSGSANVGVWVGAAALLFGVVAALYLFAPEPAPRGSIGTIDLR